MYYISTARCKIEGLVISATDMFEMHSDVTELYMLKPSKKGVHNNVKTVWYAAGFSLAKYPIYLCKADNASVLDCM